MIDTYNLKKMIFGGTILVITFVLVFSTLSNSNSISAQGNSKFTATLSGQEVVPPVKTDGTGTTNIEISPNSLSYQTNVLNTGQVSSVKIHSGATGTNGDVLVTLYQSQGNNGKLFGNLPKLPDLSSKLSDISSTTQKSSSFSASGNVQGSDLTGKLAGKTINDLLSEIQSGNTYVLVHTQDHPKGELRGQITTSN
jgi:CHRD domain